MSNNSMLLRSGMKVVDHRGRHITLESRNGCHRHMWYGKGDDGRLKLVTESQVVAVKNDNGFQTVLGGGKC